MDFADTVRMTTEWYRAYYAQPDRIADVSREQIAEYTAKAAAMGQAWA